MSLIDFSSLELFVPEMPTEAETDANRLEQMVAPFEEAKSRGNHFNVVSLEAWVALAEAAGVDVVPAEVVARIPVKTLLNFEEPKAEDQSHWDALEAVNASLGDGQMLRWDCCATLDLKGAMDQTPQAVSPADKGGLHPGDPRFFDILYQFPEQEMRVLRRPWVEARMEGSHPVEYRAFVKDGVLEGISNYYPQRALTMSATVENEVQQAIDAVGKLLKHFENEGTVPWAVNAHPSRFDLEKVSCTIDFLVEAEGKVLFLEAGPAFNAGAHPCCFEHHKDEEGQILTQGLALAKDQSPVDLPLQRAKRLNP